VTMTSQALPRAGSTSLDPPIPPAWVSEILAGGREEVTAAVGDAPLVRVIGGRGFGFLSTVVPDATFRASTAASGAN
jgi:hypothetical protein